MSVVREFLLPDLGEGLTEADIVAWRVAVGDDVALNQVIAEVETEKAVVELPSPFAGTVVELKGAPGQTIAVGSSLIAIAVDEAAGQSPLPVAEEAEEKVEMLVGYGPMDVAPSRRRRTRRHPPALSPDGGDSANVIPAHPPSGRPLAKPPVRYLARQQGIDLGEVRGTGPDGVITREDVLAHVDARPPSTRDDRETRQPIRGVRKHTAEAMVRSAFTAPHVTEFVTVDVTPTMELVEQLGASPVFEGIRVTPLLLVARALLLALHENPSLNSSWDEAAQEIVTKHYVNLGIAAATPRGLVVPSIKDAHLLSLRDLALALAALTATAREGRSTPADLAGGTITITNIGVFGIDAGTPILNPGEAAILCVGAIRRQPWEYHEEIALRSVCTLSLSFDHRLIDGQEGSLFLAAMGRMLADPTYLIALS
jgi:2-oxoisovalerate dehydrogenase E2 component (dihydrolipoyl transacylase)